MKKSKWVIIATACISLCGAATGEEKKEKKPSSVPDMIMPALPDSVTAHRLEVRRQRHLNESLHRIRSLDDVDTMNVSAADKTRLKEAFKARNPEIVVRQKAEKKKRKAK